MDKRTKILTPCNRNCYLDPKTGVCQGCHRTYKEVINWLKMDDMERQKVMERVTKRD